MNLENLYTTTYMDYKGCQVAIYTFGQGQKTILMLPSFPQSGLEYVSILKDYDLANYKIITYDIPGWAGNSSYSNLAGYSITFFDELVDGVIALLQIKEFTLLGYSFGGNIAFRLAGRKPEVINKLVLVSPVIFGDLAKKSFEYKLLVLVKLLKLEYVLTMLFTRRIKGLQSQIASIGGSVYAQQYVDLFKNVRAIALIKSLLTLFTTSNLQFTSSLSNVNQIMVVSSSQEGGLFTNQTHELRRIFPNSKNVILTGDHNTFVFDPKNKQVQQVVEYLLS